MLILSMKLIHYKGFFLPLVIRMSRTNADFGNRTPSSLVVDFPLMVCFFAVAYRILFKLYFYKRKQGYRYHKSITIFNLDKVNFKIIILVFHLHVRISKIFIYMIYRTVWVFFCVKSGDVI